MTPTGRRRSKVIALRYSSFDHFVGAYQERFGNREADRLGGFEIDDQFKSCRSHHRQVSGLLALEDAPDIDAGLPIGIEIASAVAHQHAGGDNVTLPAYGRQRMAQ